MQPWRILFFVSALFILTGGPQHPRGTMEQMLADPKWVPSHLLVLAGFFALLAGLVSFGRGALPARTRRWVRIAIAGTALQAVEMVVHTAAYVDHAHLVAGHSTPVLTTHLMMSLVFYPMFGAAMIGFIVATMRDRTMGVPWFGWFGIAGAAAHGAAPPLVLLAELPYARILFPMVMLLALWLVLAAGRPARGPVHATASSA